MPQHSHFHHNGSNKSLFFTEHVYARHCPKHFTWIIQLHPHHPLNDVLLLISFMRKLRIGEFELSYTQSKYIQSCKRVQDLNFGSLRS